LLRLRQLAALIGLVAVSMAVLACGSDDKKDTPAVPAGGASTAPAAAATSAPTGGSRIVIAVQPTANQQTLAAESKDLEKFLSDRMGREVSLMFPTSSAGVIEALRFGHAHAAFMSAWPLALAQKHAGAEVALAEVREVVIGAEKQEQPFYFSYWVVRKDSPIASVGDLKGKKVAFPSALSTSGYVAPMARMVELGLLQKDGTKEVDPKKFFGEVFMAGGYQQGWEALKAGQVDATVIAGDVSEALYREVLANTKVVEQQGPIPSHGVAFAKQLDASSRQQLTDALLALNAPDNRALMRKFISGIFVGFKKTTAEEHLGSLTKFLEATNLDFVERLR
jgi:phosphonate transport system substrate-binding protein